MKFWQKAYLCVMIVFLVGFDVSVFLFVNKSYTLIMEDKYTTAENEQYVIGQSLYNRISGVSDFYREFNENNLRMYVSPYGDYYVNQGIYMELYYKDSLVYSNFPHIMGERPELKVESGQKSTITRKVNGILYYISTVCLSEPYSGLKFVYIKNIQDLEDYKTEMISHAKTISILISVILSILILGMLLKLTHPIRKLKNAAVEIAEGHYQKRIEVKGSDEVGELAQSFNAMAESVEKHIQKLSDVSEERQRFINNLAHEMRTPITAIMGYGEFLRNANFTQEERLKAVDYIVDQSERMKNMTHKLMELARLDHVELSMELIDLQIILEHVEATLMQDMKAKGISLEKNLQISFIQGDKDLIESLLLNIMENAIRALPGGGKINVWTEGDKSSVALSVADNGIGIEEQEISKVFEPFYRVDKSRSRVHGGAGLGMALCKQICDLHKAELEITSRLGKGTKVTIKFTTLTQLHDDSAIGKD